MKTLIECFSLSHKKRAGPNFWLLPFTISYQQHRYKNSIEKTTIIEKFLYNRKSAHSIIELQEDKWFGMKGGYHGEFQQVIARSLNAV
ncbi:hypothetical protein KZ483_25775 [Paenibacillus sp. sptzw28]|uniref:hypothetical protein n=1 Tax=Paenibacillus sp. sptzw28 TaxID=715179 RepID=UPI001C6EEF1F|nr:hypothetical protein [Paenibacillus sp. sptzw28]QYR21087.1 hypothetical protein KZ483_25775 [Paenibacillus sp. sptzw28]